MTWQEVAKAADVSGAALRQIRRGTFRPQELTARRLDAALRWAPGSVYRVLDGGEPAPLEDQPAAVSPGATGLEAQLERAISAILEVLTPEERQQVLRRMTERVAAEARAERQDRTA